MAVHTKDNYNNKYIIVAMLWEKESPSQHNYNDTEEQYIWNHFQIFSRWWTIKTMTANQNPPEIEHTSL